MSDAYTEQEVTPSVDVIQSEVEPTQTPVHAGGLARSETSTSSLLTREQQLKEEIDRLKREEQALQQKDEQIKKNIDVLREQKQAAAQARDLQ